MSKGRKALESSYVAADCSGYEIGLGFCWNKEKDEEGSGTAPVGFFRNTNENVHWNRTAHDTSRGANILVMIVPNCVRG